MSTETARIVSLDSPNNYFLYIDFLEPLFPFPLLCFRKKREHCRKRRKRRVVLLFFIFLYCFMSPFSISVQKAAQFSVR